MYPLVDQVNVCTDYKINMGTFALRNPVVAQYLRESDTQLRIDASNQ